jgi:hypothetical protein
MGVATADELVRLGCEALATADWERARAFFEQAAEFVETAGDSRRSGRSSPSCATDPVTSARQRQPGRSSVTPLRRTPGTRSLVVISGYQY